MRNRNTQYYAVQSYTKRCGRSPFKRFADSAAMRHAAEEAKLLAEKIRDLPTDMPRAIMWDFVMDSPFYRLIEKRHNPMPFGIDYRGCSDEGLSSLLWTTQMQHQPSQKLRCGELFGYQQMFIEQSMLYKHRPVMSAFYDPTVKAAKMLNSYYATLKTERLPFFLKIDKLTELYGQAAWVHEVVWRLLPNSNSKHRAAVRYRLRHFIRWGFPFVDGGLENILDDILNNGIHPPEFYAKQYRKLNPAAGYQRKTPRRELMQTLDMRLDSRKSLAASVSIVKMSRRGHNLGRLALEFPMYSVAEIRKLTKFPPNDVLNKIRKDRFNFRKKIVEPGRRLAKVMPTLVNTGEIVPTVKLNFLSLTPFRISRVFGEELVRYSTENNDGRTPRYYKYLCSLMKVKIFSPFRDIQPAEEYIKKQRGYKGTLILTGKYKNIGTGKKAIPSLNRPKGR